MVILTPRCGDVIHTNPIIKHHVTNPDQVLNINGKKLINVLKDNKYLVIANGFISGQVAFDSSYTFYREEWKSQVDFVFTNNIASIALFKVLDKNVYSDHCPIAIKLYTTIDVDLYFVNKCPKGTFDYDCYDINKRSRNPVDWRRVDVIKMTDLMVQDAHLIMIDLHNADDVIKINKVSNQLSNVIYNACKNSYKAQKNRREIASNTTHCTHCTHCNYKAIAEINLHTIIKLLTTYRANYAIHTFKIG